MPVYEIYKVGADPEWVPGLDLLGELTGVAAAVVPHYDNKEGATHDTRFCYLGEERLTALEAELPDEVGVLGVDEHTAMLIDVEARTMTVAGNGVVSVRRAGRHPDLRGRGVADPRRAVGDAPRRAGRVTGAGARGGGAAEPVDVERPGDVVAGRGGPGPGGVRGGAGPPATSTAAWPPCSGWRRRSPPGRPTPCRATTPTRPAGCCARWWSGSASWPSRAPPTRPTRSRRSSRRCWRCGPAARENKDFATSDLVRDRLVAAGVEVRDAPDGTSWTLTRT